MSFLEKSDISCDRCLVFINPLLNKAIAKLSPIFDPIKQASRSLYSKYSERVSTNFGFRYQL